MIEKLPPREREVFEALLALEEASVAEIQARMADPPGSSAMRAMLARLERKGVVSHEAIDHQNVYRPSVPAAVARTSALSRLVRTFFDNQPAAAATALLGMQKRIEPEQLDALEALIRRAREERTQ